MLNISSLQRVIKRLGRGRVALYIGRCENDMLSGVLTADEMRAVSSLDSVMRFGSGKALQEMLDAKLNQLRLTPTEDDGVFMIDGHPLFRLSPNKGHAQIILLKDRVYQDAQNKPLDAIIAEMRQKMIQRCRARGYAVAVLDAIQDEKSLFLRGYGSREHLIQCNILRAQVKDQLSATIVASGHHVRSA